MEEKVGLALSYLSETAFFHSSGESRFALGFLSDQARKPPGCLPASGGFLKIRQSSLGLVVGTDLRDDCPAAELCGVLVIKHSPTWELCYYS